MLHIGILSYYCIKIQYKLKNKAMKTSIKKIVEKTFITLTLCTLIFTTSCKKPEKGATGPAGPTGNANVQSTTVTISNWSYSAPSYYVNLSYSAITSNIINSGAVLVYAQTGTGTYSQLPLTVYPSSSYSSSLEVVSSLGSVQVIWTDSDLTQPANPGTWTFKIVAIASSAIAENPNVDLNDYNQVKAAFNLND